MDHVSGVLPYPEYCNLIDVDRWTDADTLIVNPLVAIHDLLPPSTLSPPPLILANQDSGGFNDGVTLFRVNHRLATFLSQVISLSHEMTSLWHLGTGGEGPPSDQRAIAITLLANRDLCAGFYEIPQSWLNAYDLDAQEGEFELRAQVHLVNERKYGKGAEEAVERASEMAERVYEGAQRLAVRSGESGGREERDQGENGLGLMDEVGRVREEAERWWSTAVGGVEGMVFSGV